MYHPYKKKRRKSTKRLYQRSAFDTYYAVNGMLVTSTLLLGVLNILTEETAIGLSLFLIIFLAFLHYHFDMLLL